MGKKRRPHKVKSKPVEVPPRAVIEDAPMTSAEAQEILDTGDIEPGSDDHNMLLEIAPQNNGDENEELIKDNAGQDEHVEATSTGTERESEVEVGGGHEEDGPDSGGFDPEVDEPQEQDHELSGSEVDKPLSVDEPLAVPTGIPKFNKDVYIAEPVKSEVIFNPDDGLQGLDKYEYEMRPKTNLTEELAYENQQVLYGIVLTILRDQTNFNPRFTALLDRFNRNICYTSRYIHRGLLDNSSSGTRFPKWLPKLYHIMTIAAKPATRLKTAQRTDLATSVLGMPQSQASLILEYFNQ